MKSSLSPCTGENDPMGSSMKKQQKGFCTPDQRATSGGLTESDTGHFEPQGPVFKPFLSFFITDEPIGSFSHVQGVFATCMTVLHLIHSMIKFVKTVLSCYYYQF